MMRKVVLAMTMLAAMWPQGATAETESHCAYRLEPVAVKGPTTLATLVDLGCYDTFAEALSTGSEGTIVVDASMTPEALTDADLTASATAASDVLIGTEYDAINYSSSSVSYFAPVTCSSTKTWDVSYVGDLWNDRFASGRGFGGCDHNRKFKHADFNGDVQLCTPNCPSYGVLTEEVSSLRWKD